MAHSSDADIIAHTHNTARYFVSTRHVSWVLLIATCLWGVYGFLTMPQRKDPDVPVRIALVLTSWPGASSEKVEQLVTQKIEETIAKNSKIEKLESVSRTGLSAVYITLDEAVKDRGKEFDDIKLKLDAIANLPDGAGPIQFVKDFGDTAALMLTVASPKVDRVALELRAASIRQAVDELRREVTEGSANRLRQDYDGPAQAGHYDGPAQAGHYDGPAKAGHDDGKNRLTLVQPLPQTMTPSAAEAPVAIFVREAIAEGAMRDVRTTIQPGFVAIDGVSSMDETALAAYVGRFMEEHLKPSELHPDAGPPIVVRNPADTLARLTAVAGDRYTYRELDDYTDLVARTLRTLPIVSKVDRSGVLNEQVTLEYSQERLASYGVTPSSVKNILGARNITLPGGVIEAPGKTLTVDPSGEFTSEREIGDVLVPTANGGRVYLRDLANIVRGYTSPPSFLNYYGRRDPDGTWQRTRAVTLAVQMKSGGQIGEFAKAVDAALDDLKARLPNDLVLARTSDQPTQVHENIELFMGSLEEAIILVVVVSLIGFWEWRSALLMAMSIGGEQEEQLKSFKNQARVMLMSTVMIFLALVIQFKHAAKPFIVFAGIPFGIAGALAFLVITGTPFGFMAFLGIASLVGVIVSHVVVLFDFIEEAHERGETLEESLLDAGIVRLRPVLITVAATVIALIPLAMHGGPLWVPMCYAQIGGLTVATFVTLVIVPVIYAIFVKDLKLVKWENLGHTEHSESHDESTPASTPAPVAAHV